MPGGVAVNHGDAWPAQGKGSGSSQKKKRSGAADLEIHQGILKGGAKTCGQRNTSPLRLQQGQLQPVLPCLPMPC